MSCIYKTYNPETDGPYFLYHRMNQIDCAMKKFGGSYTKRNKRRRNKSRMNKNRKRDKKSRTKTRPRTISKTI